MQQTINYREINNAVMTDTMEMCRLVESLKKSIDNSIKNEYVVYQSEPYYFIVKVSFYRKKIMADILEREMIHAYDKLYLSKAQNNMASMLDFAVYDLKENLSEFYQKFLYSKVSKQLERGESTV